MPVADALHQVSVGGVTCCRWRPAYGGLKSDQVKRLNEPEIKGARPRKALTDLTPDKLILQEAARGNS